MKLFQVSMLTDNDTIIRLCVAETKEIAETKMLMEYGDEVLYSCNASEVTEVDGYDIALIDTGCNKSKFEQEYQADWN